MQGHESRRIPSRSPWPDVPPPGALSQGGTPRYCLPTTVRSFHPPLENGLLKQAATLPAVGNPSRFQPYRAYQARQQFDFKIQDLELCLYGKQDMRVVQINDQLPKHPPKEVNGAGDSSNTASSTTAAALGVGKEDTKKPARWCDNCQEIRFGECPKHGPLSSRPSAVLTGPKSYAISTFPEEVGLCISTIPLSGYGVFARHYIPTGTWIGPYEGKKISVEEGLKQISEGDASFLWEIYENYSLAHFLDASDENTSSWMRFIQCARHPGEQNLFVFQYYGSIYYRAFKDILSGAELLVWYDDKYPQYFGIPFDICDLSSYTVDSWCKQNNAESSKGAVENVCSVSNKHAPEPGHPPTRHPEGLNIIHGTGKMIHSVGGAREKMPFSRHGHSHPPSTYQTPPVQPPNLSQAPPIINARSPHHSSIYVTAGRSHLPQYIPPPHEHSPRPGSVNPSFRREIPTSSMLRSMSADDLRRRGAPPPHARDRLLLEREHLERIPPNTVEHSLLPPPPGSSRVLHQFPHGAIPHFSSPVGSSAGFTRFPPSVMSVTPISVEHSKNNKNIEDSKHSYEMKAFYERERILPNEQEKLIRAEQDRMLQMRDRALLERGHLGVPLSANGMMGTSLLGGPRPTDRVLHEGQAPPSGEAWDVHRCKMCRKTFSHKTAYEKHHCVTEIQKQYPCSRCELSFHDPRDLQDHAAVHNSDRGFHCVYCGKSFQSPATLQSHMRIHDSPNSNSSASHSSKMQSGKPPPPPLFDCVKCGKRFVNAVDLNKHMNAPGECVT